MQQTFEITWWRGSPSGPVPEQTRVQSRTKKAVTDDAIGDTIERWVECRTCCTPLDQFAISEQMVKTDDSEAFLERVAVRNPAVHGPMTARKEETARAYLTEADAVLRTLPDERLQSANIAAAAASITAALRFLHDPRVKE